MRLLPVAVLLLFSSAASAAPVLFTDRADFDAAVGAHQLFTDFPTQIVPGSLYDLGGNFGGLAVRADFADFFFDTALGMRGINSAGNGGFVGLFANVTAPVSAIGFDVLFATRAAGPAVDAQFRPLHPEILPTTLSVGWSTLAGERALYAAPSGSFFGVLLFDDTFQALSLSTSAGCSCHTGFAIDNLAVAGPQSVPEPVTAALLGLGVLGIAAARRRRLAATR